MYGHCLLPLDSCVYDQFKSYISIVEFWEKLNYEMLVYGKIRIIIKYFSNGQKVIFQHVARLSKLFCNTSLSAVRELLWNHPIVLNLLKLFLKL